MEAYMRTIFLTLAAYLLISGCASSGSMAAGMSYRDPNLITLEEIRNSEATDAFSLVRSLRFQWLRKRGSRSITFLEEASMPVVYVNGTYFGDVYSLEQLANNDIREIRFFGPSDTGFPATRDHPGGVILVIQF